MNSTELGLIKEIDNKINYLKSQKINLTKLLEKLPDLNQSPYSELSTQLDRIVHYEQKLRILKVKMDECLIKQVQMVERSEKLKLLAIDYFERVEQRKEVQIEKIKAKIATDKILNISRVDSSSGNTTNKPTVSPTGSEISSNLITQSLKPVAGADHSQAKEITITTKKKVKSKSKKEKTIDPKFLKLMDKLNIEENKN
ncbi:hypothetical protein CONCODRAFT_2398 [Conidiobolus coronatus NRRL 28638]|uniref:Uncharacterized protein n=1 Tax=Conidiobolus coronatus (strain ATCC 28846 / CBS 209.66 / NRRL 28638) TaxID=796925 RepID=A0A137PHW6_CONC2|nr:hypothetical protein CONCODRAFT_2398 [Conidiobolus coronatus NRRL 28638]|eukprot:KXN74594.1 hypothetical protein CONCODRAFT_2398 [Conidiobolus coronatus NRRL 28638]